MICIKNILLFSVCLLAYGCASGVNQADLNRTIQVNYGVVQSIEPVKLKSNAGSSALLGGIIGAATSGSHDRGLHAAEGALALGLLTAATEKHTALAYQVAMKKGGTIKVITEQAGIREGDCVSVEQGRTTNVRTVAGAFCGEPNHPVHDHPEIQAHVQTEAQECHTAKEILMQAKTEAEVDLAMKKVQIFCGH